MESINYYLNLIGIEVLYTYKLGARFLFPCNQNEYKWNCHHRCCNYYGFHYVHVQRYARGDKIGKRIKARYKNPQGNKQYNIRQILFKKIP